MYTYQQDPVQSHNELNSFRPAGIVSITQLLVFVRGNNIGCEES